MRSIEFSINKSITVCTQSKRVLDFANIIRRFYCICAYVRCQHFRYYQEHGRCFGICFEFNIVFIRQLFAIKEPCQFSLGIGVN